jgi:hypothetical protein
METIMGKESFVLLTAYLFALGAGACGSDGATTGAVTISLEAEETITSGLDPGPDLENIQDGWTVRFQRVLYTVGNVAAKSTETGAEIAAKDVYLLDLTRIAGTGFELLSQKDVAAVRYDEVSFSNPLAKASFKKGPSVSDSDLTMMVDNGWSIYAAGEITKPDGQSCTPGKPQECAPAPSVKFSWGANAATDYTHCGSESGDLGFAVVSGGTTGATFTIHGDHWFFNSFVVGAEIVERQAQWVANVDFDHDGTATLDELKKTLASDVFPSSKYSLAGAPVPVMTAYDFLVAQSHTIGHFQGEGDCEWEVVK